jgi:NAD(P)-dependent dehydrogenase (short-subunit alcohol dehydrogenase family)
MPDTSATSTLQAWVITGPTSGIGYRTALELAKHGTVVLVGRDAKKLAEVEAEINSLPNGRAVSVIADFSEPDSVRQAAFEIVGLDLPIAGVLNNAGLMSTRDGVKTPRGWDVSFATNHLGPFAFTEALIPHLPPGTNVVFTASAVEDPERKPATASGFRGARYISAEASVRGEWKSGGSTHPGFDAYATSKQGNLATVFVLSREHPTLRFNAVEPGFNPGSDLARDANPALVFLSKYVLSPLAPMIKYWSTPKIASRMIAKVLTEKSTDTGVYYDEGGKPMQASKQISDPAFSRRFIAETRALLAEAPSNRP